MRIGFFNTMPFSEGFKKPHDEDAFRFAALSADAKRLLRLRDRVLNSLFFQVRAEESETGPQRFFPKGTFPFVLGLFRRFFCSLCLLVFRR